MAVKEMSIQEKYDKLYDQYVLTGIVAMAFAKEIGLTNQFLKYSMTAYKKIMPSLMGSVFKLIKMLSPGRVF